MPKKNETSVNKPAATKQRHADAPAVAASSSLAADQNNVQYLASPVKSDLDLNEYRSILLSNGLRAVLVALSNDKARKVTASCHLTINVGVMSNLPKVPGLSSVLSRALEYLDVVGAEDSGGEVLDRDDNLEDGLLWMNEYWEETQYELASSVEKYRETLEAFVQTIVNLAPTREHVEMERIRNEDPLSINSSSGLMPLNNADKAFVNLAPPWHPMRTAFDSFFARFDHIPEEQLYTDVMAFRKRHYSANRMAVLLQAPLPLDTLETYAMETLSKIPNNGLPPETFEPYNFENSFDRTKLPRIWIVPDDDGDNYPNHLLPDSSSYKMQIHWIMPPTRSVYKAKSLEYLAWIFDANGAGTLRDYLINKNWAQNVIATVPWTDPWNTTLHSTLTITVHLSDEGNNHVINILDAIYSYINLLKREGPQRGIYDGIRINEDAKFKFRVEGSRGIFQNLHQYESADYISGPHLYGEYDPVSIANCTELMAPAKGCVFINNDEFLVPFKTDEAPDVNAAGSRSFGFPEELIERWKTIAPLPEFKLPEANKFWPDDFTIIDPPKTYTKNPSIVHSDAVSEVWYKFDPSVRAPMCHMNLCYSSPLPLESAENSVMLTLFGKVLQALIRHESELAKRAGLSNSVEVYSSKLVIAIHGFRQKIPQLMETIAQFVRESHFLLTKELFELVRSTSYEKYAKIWSEPIRLARNIRKSILMPGRWTAMDNDNAILSITFAKFQNFLERFTNHVHMKFLVQGNVSESMAIETARRVVKLSKCKVCPTRTMPQRLINKIPPGTHRCKIKIDSEDTSLCYLIDYYQFDDSTIERAVLIDALKILLHDCHRFTKLRDVLTRKQYFFLCAENDHYSVNNVWFERHEKSNDIEKIRLIDKRSLRRLTSALTDSVWGDLKSILLSKAIRKSRYEFMHNWNEIIHGECDFGRHSREIDAIKKLKAENFIDFITQLISDDSAVRKLSIMVIGCGEKLMEATKINLLNYKVRLENFHEFPSLPFEYFTEYITDVAKFKNELERPL